MWKSVLAGTAAVAIAGSTLALAQQGGATDGAGPRREHAQRGDRMQRGERGPGWRMSAEDRSAFTDARIAALKAGLKLTPDQEKIWPPVEAAMRDLAKQRADRFAARASADRPKDMLERLTMRADMMTQSGAALKKLADAASPLYKSLDDGQKRRFTILARLGGERGPGMGRGHHGWRGGPEGRGPEGRGPRGRGPDLGPDGSGKL